MLRLNQLSYRHLLKDVCLLVNQGEAVGLVGQSGSGKTLTAQAIMGFIRPDSGEIWWNDLNLCLASTDEWRKIRKNEIGMVFQNPATALNPTMRIAKQLGEALGTFDRQSIRSLLEKVGLAAERMDDYPFQFSGGMRQRIVIAMAIAKKPLLLIADEPTTALDAVTQKEILQLLKMLALEHKMALLLISHDLAVIRQMCQRVYIMHQGRVVESDTVDQVLKDPQHFHTKEIVTARHRLAGAQS